MLSDRRKREQPRSNGFEALQFRQNRPTAESTYSALLTAWRAHPFAASEARREGGKAPKCGLSLARFIAARLGARRVAGETLDKFAILQDHVKAFA
jgi:hypothetical protein